MVLKKTPDMPVACERHGLLLAIRHVTTVLVTLSLVVEAHATAAKCKQVGWEFLSMREGLVVGRFAPHQPLPHTCYKHCSISTP